MAYNNGFPVTYQQMYPQFQNPYLQPQFQQYQAPQQQQAQAMTPPTVHADIIQIASEQEGTTFPVAAGASQMMITKDESTIMVKTAFANGQTTLSIYDKRPPAPAEKPVDLSVYVTREELESRLAALTAPKRQAKKETEAAES
jgi:hypothetical protein